MVLGILAILVVSGCATNNNVADNSNYNSISPSSQTGQITGPDSKEVLTESNIPGDADNQYKIKFAEHKAYTDKKGLIHIVGKVISNTTKGISSVWIDATPYDKNGNLIYQGPISSGSTIIEDWNPGEVKDFEIELPAYLSLKIARYYLKFDGETLILKPGQDSNTQTCTPNWQCSSWSECNTTGTQTRSCIDMSNCATNESKPIESQACIMTLYDDFSESELNLTKWSIDYGCCGPLTENYIDVTRGVYHMLQDTPFSPGKGVSLTMENQLQPGNIIEYDLDYVSGSGNNIHNVRINNIPWGDLETSQCSDCYIGFWNNPGRGGTDFGKYKVRMELGNSLFLSVKKPDGSYWNQTFSLSKVGSPPFTLTFITGTGHDGIMHFDLDNFYIG